MKFKKLASIVMAVAMVSAMSISGFADNYPEVNQANNNVKVLNDATVFAPDTYFDSFALDLDLYMMSSYLGTVTGKGDITYSESNRWVKFDRVDLVHKSTPSGSPNRITELSVSGNGTSVATAEFRVDAINSQTRYVRITAYYNGNVTIQTI